MKRSILLLAAILLAGCAGPGGGTMSGASGTRGSTASSSGGRVYNADVREAVSRGSTQGFNPLPPTVVE